MAGVFANTLRPAIMAASRRHGLRRAAEGMSFLIASSDHDEVASVCDRIHVFRDGRIAATLETQPFNPEQIAALASEGA